MSDRNGWRNVLLSIAGVAILTLLSIAGYLLAADRQLLERRDEATAAALLQHGLEITALKAGLEEMKKGQTDALEILRRLDRRQRKATSAAPSPSDRPGS